MKKTIRNVLRLVFALTCLMSAGCRGPGGGPKYPDVQYAMIFLPQHLEAYVKTDGSYIIDYYDVSGQHHFKNVWPTGTSVVPLYNGNGNNLKLGKDNAVDLTEPVSGGSNFFNVNPQGIMAEQNTQNGVKHMAVHFIDQANGLDIGVADINDVGGGQLAAEFRPPISGSYPVTTGLTSIYFSFDLSILGETGTGTVTLIHNGAGDLIGSAYSHS
jgi:hypothetical protein